MTRRGRPKALRRRQRRPARRLSSRWQRRTSSGRSTRLQCHLPVEWIGCSGERPSSWHGGTGRRPAESSGCEPRCTGPSTRKSPSWARQRSMPSRSAGQSTGGIRGGATHHSGTRISTSAQSTSTSTRPTSCSATKSSNMSSIQLRRPRTLLGLCRPGGLCVVATPFLYKVHAAPDDYWRFTPHGLGAVLDRAGFVDIETESWGNTACIKGNFARDLPNKRWRSLRAGDPSLPIVVWAFAGPRSRDFVVCALGGIRTPNLLIRSQMLYPLSYERRASHYKRLPRTRSGAVRRVS